MPKEYVNPNSLFPSLPHGFSQVVIASGRKMVFVSGQAAWDARKNIVGGDSVLEQARQAFRNLEKAMEAAGGTLRDIVALRIYVVDYQAESGTAVGTVLREFFLRRIRLQVPGSASRPWQFQNFSSRLKRQRFWTERCALTNVAAASDSCFGIASD